jgi:hypothetical protein
MQRTIVSSSIIVGIALIYFCHVRLRPGDLPFYRKLVQESADLRGSSALEKSPVRQRRQKVQKDIWTLKDGARVHGRIACEASELTLTQKKEKMEGVEVLQGIDAWIDLGDEMRRLNAESGTCRFPSLETEAGPLSFQFGETKCFAHRGYFSKDLDQLQFLGSFQIEHPKGRIFGEKGTLTAEGAGNRLQFEEGVLFEGAQAPFSIASLTADAVIPHNATLPEEIRFSESVEIQSAHGLRAAGDTAIYRQNFLRLLPKPGSLCSIFHGEIQVDAREIQFDKEENVLLCLSPHGRLVESRTVFDADTGRAQFLYCDNSKSVKNPTAESQKRFLNEPFLCEAAAQAAKLTPADSHFLGGSSIKGYQPAILLLEGNVRIASHLQKKESFALADSAALHLDQKRIVLESAPSSRVLFRQEGLEISAPTIYLQESAIQGFGDVRFSFSPEEKTTLEPLFLKFLNCDSSKRVKNDQEAAQIFVSGTRDVLRDTARSEEQKYAAKLTPADSHFLGGSSL